MKRRHFLRLAAAGGVSPGALASPLRDPSQGRASFAFGLIGDLPYSVNDEVRLSELLAELGQQPLDFVIHVGDIKRSLEPCSDSLFARRKAILANSPHPLILLPGDNDWTDCHRLLAGSHDPQERLASLRRTLWSDAQPLGGSAASGRPPLRLTRQTQQPENLRWQTRGVHFIALHVVGSNNGLDAYPGSGPEFAQREALNRQWLFEGVQAALREKADALVLAIHADPEFDRRNKKGFEGFLSWLQEVAGAFRRPILLLHGDGHRFRVDRPLRDASGRRLDHLTRIECFGYPMTSSWVRIVYEPGVAQRFLISTGEVRPRGQS